MTDRKASILIVEDDTNQRLSLRTVLDFEGYDVDEAPAALPALELLRHTVFDAWIVDYRLPDLTGVDFIKQGLAISPQAVPILITGLNALDIAIEGMKAGARDYLVKPINMSELKKILSAIMVERADFEKGKTKMRTVLENIGEVEPQEQVNIIEAPPDVIASLGGRSSGTAGLFRRMGTVVREYFWDIR